MGTQKVDIEDGKPERTRPHSNQRIDGARPLSATAAAARRGEASLDNVIVLLVALVECVLVLAGMLWAVKLHWLLLGHVLCVGGLALRVYFVGRSGEDVSELLLALLATLATGPLGATGALLATLITPRTDTTPLLLEDWYERISHSTDVDKVTQFCDMVAIGRAINLGGPLPVSFETVMNGSSLSAKQNALGLIARKFHPEYLPALSAALQSDQPVIRVQAAAVAAHVRETIAQMLGGLVEEAAGAGADPARCLSLAGQIEQCLSSGLLDEKDRVRGRAAADKLYSLAIAYEDGLPELNGRVSQTASGGKIVSAKPPVNGGKKRTEVQAYEALLLRRGDFSAFRRLRASLPDIVPGMRRVRTLPERHGRAQERGT